MSLVIVESPAKCKKIQGFLGTGWTVVATMGHIRALEEDLDAVGLERDFEARFAFLDSKKKAIAQLKDAARNATAIYIASDDDREGEAIAYSVALLLKLDPQTARRSVFHEITKAAITKAVQEPRLIDMNRVNAQQARSILDMMVGFTISRLLWSYVGNALSAGRCQTPALRLVCDREREIEGFTSERAWKLNGSWSTDTLEFDACIVDDLEDEESARNFLDNIHEDAKGTIQSSSTKAWSQSPPKPLITSTLQQEASALFHVNPKSTMQIAQRLYEAGHITYMRTDHPMLSEEAILLAQNLLREQFGKEYLAPLEPKKKPAKGKKEEAATNAQEAHEAIRPTHFEMTELPQTEDWNAIDKKIYGLIRNRSLQSVMANARGEEHTIRFVADGDPGEFEWSAAWKRTTFLGWKRIGVAEVNLDNEGAQDEKDSELKTWSSAITLKKGDPVQWSSLNAYPVDSRPLPRYTEATLVRELEKRGIGRPSTFASLVGTIQEKGYVEKKEIPAKELKLLHLHLPRVGAWPPVEETRSKKMGGDKDKLSPTSLGIRMVEFCLREFSDLFDYSFTSKMESRLDLIAEGTEPWKQLCRDTWISYKDKYEALRKAGASAKKSSDRQKEFRDGLKAVIAKQGPLLLIEDKEDKSKTKFFEWPKGLKFEDITEEEAWAHVQKEQERVKTVTLGDHEGAPIIIKEGPYGKYAECGGVRVPFAPGDTAEILREKLIAKKNAVLHTLGDFEFRTGPYGIFMMKKTIAKGKKPQFVGLPEGLDPKSLTEEAAVRIYQTGLQQKARTRQFGAQRGGASGASAASGAASGASGGAGGRGRGGFRGGRGGFRGGFRGGRGGSSSS